MDSGERDELVHTLTRRRTILAALDDRPRHKRDLTEELHVARSTIDRALRKLETEGLVERGDDGFSLTTHGEIAFDVYGDFTERLDALWGARRRRRAPLQSVRRPDVPQGCVGDSCDGVGARPAGAGVRGPRVGGDARERILSDRVRGVRGRLREPSGRRRDDRRARVQRRGPGGVDDDA